MLDDDKLAAAVQDMIIDICEPIYRRGYKHVPMGALMRLLGIDNERAMLHDNELYVLDQEFEELLAQKKYKKETAGCTSAPAGATLH